MSLVFSILATVAVCAPVWPGQMSYDGLYAYASSIHGIESMVWPPMHAYLFWLSRNAGAGVGGLFLVQTWLIFLGAALSAGLLIRSRRLHLAALAGFALLVVVVAPMLGVMLVHWRDVLTGSFAMASLACWLLAARYRAPALLVAAALALGLGVALRYNAFALFVLSAPLMVWRPYLGRPAGMRARATAVLALAAAVALAWGSIHWRLPDFKRLPAAGTLTNIQVFDLLGVSSCEEANYLPLSVTRGQPLTPAQVRQLYDPRHVQLSFRPHPGIPQLYVTHRWQTPALAADVARAWRAAVAAHPGCYLKHRAAVFVEQMGLARGPVFYPTHGVIDPNPYGLALAHPAASQALTAYILRASAGWLARPVWLYLAAAAVALALLVRRDPRSLLALALLGGAVANEALLFIVAPEADARYIFPGNLLCALLVAAGLAMLTEGRDGDCPAG